MNFGLGCEYCSCSGNELLLSINSWSDGLTEVVLLRYALRHIKRIEFGKHPCELRWDIPEYLL